MIRLLRGGRKTHLQSLPGLTLQSIKSGQIFLLMDARVVKPAHDHPIGPSIVELADMVLRVELDAELLDQIDLGLEEIDVMLLVLHQPLELVA